MYRESILYHKYEDCCGCTACSAICPRDAISFQYNEEGFLYPKINQENCIECYLCEKVCSFQRDIKYSPNIALERKIYAVKHRQKNVVKQSSSGGVFTALSDYFMVHGNAVASSVYLYDETAVRLTIYTDENSRNDARGSKYIQAETGEAFNKICEWLVLHPQQEMMIVGTGCQIAGLDLLLKEKQLRERVLLVDLICHGVSSSKLWKDYSKKLEKDKSGRISYLTFKNKDNGWKNPSAFVVINEKRESIKPFSEWFYSGWILRESCYQCPYTKVERMGSDITIGDYWGVDVVKPEFYDKNGVSLVILQNEKGKYFFNKIKNDIFFEEISKEMCSQPRLLCPASRPKNREKFWNDMRKYGIKYCSEHYTEKSAVSWRRRLKNIIKKLKYN